MSTPILEGQQQMQQQFRNDGPPHIRRVDSATQLSLSSSTRRPPKSATSSRAINQSDVDFSRHTSINTPHNKTCQITIPPNLLHFGPTQQPVRSIQDASNNPTHNTNNQIPTSYTLSAPNQCEYTFGQINPTSPLRRILSSKVGTPLASANRYDLKGVQSQFDYSEDAIEPSIHISRSPGQDTDLTYSISPSIPPRHSARDTSHNADLHLAPFQSVPRSGRGTRRSISRENNHDNQLGLDSQKHIVKSLVADYEEAMNVLQQRYEAALEGKDQEVKKWKKKFKRYERESSTGGTADVAILLKASEKELSKVFESKDKEIAALHQEVKSQKNIVTNLQSLFSGHNPTSARGPTFSFGNPEQLHEMENLPNDVPTLRSMFKEMAHINEELKTRLTQKEKEVAAFSSIDPSLGESSAVQLGVKAISMVSTSLELKEKIRALEAMVSSLKDRYDETNAEKDRTFELLSDKRKEVSKLIETVASKDMNIARLDTLLQHKVKEFKATQDQFQAEIGVERLKSSKLTNEVKILQGQCDKMRNELANRDERILKLQDDEVRSGKAISDLEKRMETLSSELAEAQGHIHRMVKATVAKDRYVTELERRMKESDVKRQATYLQEVAKNRKLQMDFRIKEDDTRHVLHSKEDEIRHLRGELTSSVAQVKAVKSLLLANPKFPSPFVGAGEEEIEGTNTPPHKVKNFPRTNRGRHHPSYHQHAATYPVTDIQNTHPYHSHPYNHRGIDDYTKPLSGRNNYHSVQQHAANVHYSDTGSFNDIYTSRRHQPLMTAAVTKALMRGGDERLPSALKTMLYSEYNACPDDAIDSTLASYLRDERHKPLVGILCRLSQGSYLLGTEKLYLRLRDQRLEGRFDSELEDSGAGQRTGWLPFDDLVSLVA